ncbi:hypothetical protein RJ639_005752 [Escallonia herrerae]|uniref:PPM-type phosphatase domain-containing protein n=1 Tax=Escallonia herrerae TaxID=1293975 RepID=A0AA88VXK7_9ASTE|nr:hypothetical protein RJ639_005752 [Escallonia herrerae]
MRAFHKNYGSFFFWSQAFRLKRFVIRDGGNSKKVAENGKKPSWMVPVSHGYHVVGKRSVTGESEPDSVVVQREQIAEHELWFFGVFDDRIADGVTKYLQSNLFHKKLTESQMRRKSKETMKKAYLGAKVKINGTEKTEETRNVGSASAIVVDGEKLVMANMGSYRAVVCRDGEAHPITKRHQQVTKRHWSHKLIPGKFYPCAIRFPKVRILASDTGSAAGSKPSKSSELAVGSERIDAETEFVVLASTGIWEVMKHQEAVSLIRHIEDPQEAAECLAKEALTRMSRSNISCLVIRFE